MEEKKENCTKCKYFRSFCIAYDGDDMEPTDQGFCDNDKSPLEGNEGAGLYEWCGYFEKD